MWPIADIVRQLGSWRTVFFSMDAATNGGVLCFICGLLMGSPMGPHRCKVFQIFRLAWVH